MKILILTATLGISALSTSNAFAFGYRCSVEANGDYFVEINPTSDRAAMFDNNEWSVIEGSDGFGTFDGLDSYGDKLTIHFDYTEGLVQHHWIKYVESGELVKSEMNCLVVKELSSGI